MTNIVSPTSKRQRLRQLLVGEGSVISPGIYDCLSAKLVERAGFDATIVTGAGLAASVLGLPDVGLVTMSESLSQTRNICNSVSIPVVADCDTGYGNPINVGRTVREFEAAGVAALFIEDQVAPKRCGHFQGKQVISAEAMVHKIKSALDNRVDPELILIARTDACGVTGPEDALRRAHLYLEAGCDMLYVEAPDSADQVRYFGKELAPLKVPLMINLVEGGRTPLIPVDELTDLGYKFISFSGSLQKASIKTMQGLLSSLHEHRSIDEYYPNQMVSVDERSEILGLPEFYELEKLYAND